MFPRLSRFNVLDDMFDDVFSKEKKEMMQTDVKEKNGFYIIDMNIPGCDKKDIQIELKDGYLTITATINNETNEEENENYIHRERFYGKCSRSFYAGENIKEEDINASYKNGILTLTFPKNIVKEKEEKKYIEISD